MASPMPFREDEMGDSLSKRGDGALNPQHSSPVCSPKKAKVSSDAGGHFICPEALGFDGLS
jgi:hypothetical protein